MLFWWLATHYWRLIKHKWFVLVAGFRMFPISAPYWRLLIHDLSKARLCEAIPYAKHFSGKQSGYDFDVAWLRHCNSNDHHFEWWIDREDGKMRPIEMPTDVIIEMVADWLAACRAYNGSWPIGNNWDWFNKNWKTVRKQLAPETAFKVALLLKLYVKGIQIELDSPFSDAEEQRQ